MDTKHIRSLDPKLLAYEFPVEWARFQDSRVNLFFAAFLERQIDLLRKSLDTISPEDLLREQGLLAACKRLRELLELSGSDIAVEFDNALSFIKEKYGN